MKGFRFYADIIGTEMDPETTGFVRGHLPRDITVSRLRVLGEAQIHVNCVALLTGEEHRGYKGTQECIAATFSHANSDTSLCSVSPEYLSRCRHIPEALARQLHPRLFQRLDAA